MHSSLRYAIFAALLSAVAAPAHAYIGPGAGLGAIVVTIALVLGVILLLIGLVWFPLKRALKRRKGDAAAKGQPEDPQ